MKADCVLWGATNISHLKGRAWKFSHYVTWTQTSVSVIKRRGQCGPRHSWSHYLVLLFLFISDTHFELKTLSHCTIATFSSTLKDKRIDPWHLIFIPPPNVIQPCCNSFTAQKLYISVVMCHYALMACHQIRNSWGTSCADGLSVLNFLHIPSLIFNTPASLSQPRWKCLSMSGNPSPTPLLPTVALVMSGQQWL